MSSLSISKHIMIIMIIIISIMGCILRINNSSNNIIMNSNSMGNSSNSRMGMHKRGRRRIFLL